MRSSKKARCKKAHHLKAAKLFPSRFGSFFLQFCSAALGGSPVLARACHGPARLRQLVAAGDVQTFAIELSRPKRRTHITRLNTLNDATWLLE